MWVPTRQSPSDTFEMITTSLLKIDVVGSQTSAGYLINLQQREYGGGLNYSEVCTEERNYNWSSARTVEIYINETHEKITR